MTKKVLVTGMTAQHYSPVVIDRTLSFTQAMTTLLREAGYSVHIAQPSVAWDQFYLQEYDHIMMGVSPPMALSANGIYGALSTISKTYDTGKITFFVDSSEHWQIFANLKAITTNPKSLFKEFYSRRSGYYLTTRSKDITKSVLDAIDILHNKQWPSTIYPVLPWSDEQHLTSSTPSNARSSFTGVNVDSVYRAAEPVFNSNRKNKWFVENEKSKWTKSVVASLSFPAISAKADKLRTDEQISDAITSSAGALIGPGGDKKFWWSSRYVQALNASTPVATDWKESSSIGSSWNHLAIAIEEMSWLDRFELAVTQKQEYFDSIKSREETTSYLRKIIG